MNTIFCIAFSLFVILLAGSAVIAQRNRREIQKIVSENKNNLQG